MGIMVDGPGNIMRRPNGLPLLRAITMSIALAAAGLACHPRPVRAQVAAVTDPAIWIDFKRIQRAQPALLEKQFANLASRHNGATNIYIIALAGWSSQDVFIEELNGALTSIGKALPVNKGHVVRLINNIKTLDSTPVASPDNFSAAMHAVGQAMDKDNDILILLMTSHGTRSGVALQLGRAASELTPQAVATALEEERIKNRMVIVSACYSGVFVKPLANDDTIVLTAADEWSTSFGCSAKRRWTYFGDALFNQSLRPGADLQAAFAKAKTLIRGWEAKERLWPSNPQGYFGGALTRKLQSALAAALRSRRQSLTQLR